MVYYNNKTKQYHIVEHLGCYLDGKLSGESMAIKSLTQINTKLQPLYRKNKILNPKLRRFLSNSLI